MSQYWLKIMSLSPEHLCLFTELLLRCVNQNKKSQVKMVEGLKSDWSAQFIFGFLHGRSSLSKIMF